VRSKGQIERRDPRRQIAVMRGFALGRYALALAIALVAVAACGRAVSAADELYRARAFVTGQGEAERARGFALCFAAVLVKVSGDPRLAHDPAAAAMSAQAGGFVTGFDYHDRMSGIPVHDEQGTRDRPFDLTVTFDPQKIGGALRSLGRTPWPEPRPRLAVILGVRDATASYVLSEDGERGLGQRQSLAAVAAQHGIPVVLPNSAALAAEQITYDRVSSAPRLGAVAKASGGDAALVGTLVWTESALGWTTRWRLRWRGREHRWQIRGVSFDDAFRNGIDGAAAILSGHGG
jgi:hypothetical protein